MAARALRLLIVLCVIVAAAGPAAAAPARPALEAISARPAPEATRADEGRSPRGDLRPGSITDEIGQRRDYRDRGTRLQSTARLLQEFNGGPSIPPLPIGFVAEDFAMAILVIVAAQPAVANAGDLDGDNHDDVLAATFDARGRPDGLDARSGADGHLLWHRNVSDDGALAWPVEHDLDGDGVNDLLQYDYTTLDSSETEDCEGDTCQWIWEETYRWSITAVAGADGRELWQRAFDGALREEWSDEYGSDAFVDYTYAENYRLEATNLEVLAFAGDFTGNGTPGLVLNSVDVEVTDEYGEEGASAEFVAAGRSTQTFDLNASTRVEVIAADGSTRQEMTESDVDHVALLSPLELEGGRTGLLWERAVAADSAADCVFVDVLLRFVEQCIDEPENDEYLEVARLDPSTMSDLWAVRLDGWSYVWPIGGDIDADGAEDVMTWSLAFDDEEGTESVTTQVLSSATGASVWSTPDEFDVVALTPLDAAAGDDLITSVWSIEDGEDGRDVWTLEVQRRAGRTGEILFASTHETESYPDGAGYLWSSVFASSRGGDGDGDGVADVEVARYTWYEEETEDDYILEFVDSSTIIESGRSGGRLYERTLFAPGSVDLTADLDGDGTFEAVVSTHRAGPDEVESTFAPVRLADGQSLWSKTARASSVSFTPVGNTDGVAGTDVILSTLDRGADASTWTLVNLAGGSGAERWSVTSSSQ